MKDLLIVALVPIWGSLHNLPLPLLWAEQLASFIVVLTCAILHKGSADETDWEVVSTHGLMTCMGMLIVYTHQASAEITSTVSSRMQEQTSRYFINKVQQQEQQVKSERDMALFISHEVRNPLFNISNGLEFFDQCLCKLNVLTCIEDLPPLVSSMKSCTADVKVGVQHCTHLLTNILNLSKIEQGKINWQDKTVNLAHLCDNIIALTKYMAQEGVFLSADVPSDMWVACDEQLLSQVLVNLVANALKFTSFGFVLLRVRQVTKGMLSKRAGLTPTSALVVPEDRTLHREIDMLPEFCTLAGSGGPANNSRQEFFKFVAQDFENILPIDESLPHSCNNSSSISGQNLWNGSMQSVSPKAASFDSITKHNYMVSTSNSRCNTNSGVPTTNSRCNTYSGVLTTSPSRCNTSPGCSNRCNTSSSISNSLKRMTNRFSSQKESGSEASIFQFEVCDSGPGISPAKQGKLFERFQQAGNHFGAGLGLMISQKIIQFKGGLIDLVSPTWLDEETGRVLNGSVFKFSLQLKRVTPSRAASVDTARKRECALAVEQLVSNPRQITKENQDLATLCELKVLCIDDSRLNLKQLKNKLTEQSPFAELNWTCEMALTGKRGLECLARSGPFQISRASSSPNLRETSRLRSTSFNEAAHPGHFSIVIVDSELNLDEDALSDGHEVIRHIRQKEKMAFLRGEKFHRMLIISYSGHIDQDHQNKAVAAGADIVWTKPLPSPNIMLQDILRSYWSIATKAVDTHMDYLDLNVEKSEMNFSEKERISYSHSRTEIGTFNDLTLKKLKVACDTEPSLQSERRISSEQLLAPSTKKAPSALPQHGYK